MERNDTDIVGVINHDDASSDPRAPVNTSTKSVGAVPTASANSPTGAVAEAIAHLSKKFSGDTKRYNLAIPQGLFDELQELADRRGITVVDLLRRFIKLGMLAAMIEEIPEAALIIREGNNEKELLLI